MHICNVENFATALHKVYNAALANADTGTSIETAASKVLPWLLVAPHYKLHVSRRMRSLLDDEEEEQHLTQSCGAFKGTERLTEDVKILLRC